MQDSTERGPAARPLYFLLSSATLSWLTGGMDPLTRLLVKITLALLEFAGTS